MGLLRPVLCEGEKHTQTETSHACIAYQALLGMMPENITYFNIYLLLLGYIFLKIFNSKKRTNTDYHFFQLAKSNAPPPTTHTPVL